MSAFIPKAVLTAVRGAKRELDVARERHARLTYAARSLCRHERDRRSCGDCQMRAECELIR